MPTSMTGSALQSYLAKNPRMMGILFVTFLVLTQIGVVTAGSMTIFGP